MWKWKLLISILKFISGDEPTLFRRLKGFQALLAEEFNTLDKAWTSRVSRLKKPDTSEPVLTTETRVAVVMQGPLRLEDDFTLETVRYYRHTMPGSAIIVSTWKDENAAALAAIEAAGGIVVASDHPEHPGSGNINRQIRSTAAGLAAARELGFEFSLKTRTDSRIYSYHVLDFLTGLVGSFPLRVETQQRGRIAILDFATRLFVPNHPADLLMFGRTSDLATYWGGPESREPEREKRPKNVGMVSDERTPEVYACESYLKRIGYPYERTIASWWRTLAELFVVVDRNAIDHFWPKYGYAQEHRARADDPARAMSLCTFRDWVNLYAYPKESAFSEDHIKRLRCDQLLEAA